MGFSLFIPIGDYEGNSGGTVQLQAKNIQAANDKEEALIWSSKEGAVNDKGIFKCPVVDVDTPFEVNVCCKANKNEEGIIRIKVKKQTQSKKPDPQVFDFEPRAIGSKGRYVIQVQVVDTDGRGIKAKVILTAEDQTLLSIFPALKPARGKFEPSGAGGAVNDHELRLITNKNGFVSVTLLNFTEARRRIHARVEGSKLDTAKTLLLIGPDKPKRVRTFDPTKSIFQNIKDNFD
jgi:hypothetical protein